MSDEVIVEENEDSDQESFISSFQMSNEIHQNQPHLNFFNHVTEYVVHWTKLYYQKKLPQHHTKFWSYSR